MMIIRGIAVSFMDDSINNVSITQNGTEVANIKKCNTYKYLPNSYDFVEKFVSYTQLYKMQIKSEDKVIKFGQKVIEYYNRGCTVKVFTTIETDEPISQYYINSRRRVFEKTDGDIRITNDIDTSKAYIKDFKKHKQPVIYTASHMDDSVLVKSTINPDAPVPWRFWTKYSPDLMRILSSGTFDDGDNFHTTVEYHYDSNLLLLSFDTALGREYKYNYNV